MASPKHILIADDEEFLCVTVAEFLREAKYKVSIVHDGADVMPFLERDIVDLVLLDLKMPIMGGFETLALIKKNSSKTRVIIMSAYGTHEDVNQAVDAGADGFIDKPFGVETVINRINEVLASPNSRPFHEPGLE